MRTTRLRKRKSPEGKATGDNPMARKKHPVLIVIAILGGVALFLGTAMFVLLKVVGPSSSLPFGEKIGVISVEGAILDSQTILSQIVSLKDDKDISAIIVRINSPGGAVAPSQEIFRELQKTSQTKKVVASLGSVAASGGYYVAAAADHIVANPGTITGSIGVIVEFVQIQELLGKIGVGFEVLKSGEFKDIGSPTRKLTPQDRAVIQSLIGEIQEQFVAAVAEGRGMPIEKVREIADGRVFSGEKAKELGLVDELGNFQDAVDITKEMAGIRGEVELVYPKKAGLRILDLFRDEAARSFANLLAGLRSRISYQWSGIPTSPLTEKR
jgi:protease-4